MKDLFGVIRCIDIMYRKALRYSGIFAEASRQSHDTIHGDCFVAAKDIMVKLFGSLQ